MKSSDLDLRDRAALFAELGAVNFDVAVIGGGITGAGIARDAAMRGLSVALVEARDFAAGTSSRSSKRPARRNVSRRKAMLAPAPISHAGQPWVRSVRKKSAPKSIGR